MERQTVSIMKACEMVGVSRRTIYNWIAANKVEYLRTAGGSIRIFVDTLVAGAGRHQAPVESHRRLAGIRVLGVMTTSSKELLHKLNNQLGVILAHAELIETKAQDAAQKARASQVVNAALQAMAVSRRVARNSRQRVSPTSDFRQLPIRNFCCKNRLLVNSLTHRHRKRQKTVISTDEIQTRILAHDMVGRSV